MTDPRGRGATTTSERAGVAAMVVATLLWGGTFVVIRDTVRALEPVTLVFLRFTAAVVLLGLAAGYLSQAIGLQSTSAGTSAFLTCMGTLFAALFAWPLLAQRPSGALVAGIALALGGSALLPSGGVMRLGAGELWTLLGSIAFALQIVVLAHFAPRTAPLSITLIQTATLALALAPFAHAPMQALASLPPTDLQRLAYLAVAGSTIAPFLQMIAQRTLPAGRIGLLFALEPVFALFFAITFGHEHFAGPWWLGATLILAGVIGVELHELRRNRAGNPKT